jgi:phosphate transport system substrate-binding protein
MSVASSAERPRRRSRPARFFGGAVVALFVALAVQMWAVLPAGADPSLDSTGSSFAGPAIQTWAGAAGIDQGLNINFQTSNSVTGMAFFADNQVDFGASDIPYSTGQSPQVPSQPYEYLPDVAGGLAMMYNLTNPNTGLRVADVNLSAQDIANIFLGKVTTWDQLNVNGDNPGLAGITTPIDAIYRSDGAGENYLLSDYLLNEVNSTFVTAQQAFGLSTSGPSSVGNPSATWPTPACENTGGCAPSQLPGYPGWTTGSGLTGASGADATSNDTLATNGAITYVETAYAKEDQLPVANLLNASGQYVQPTSVNVAIALEKAILHADLTQDLTGVYSNNLTGAYPLSSYSYFITPCQPSQAAQLGLAACASGTTGTSTYDPTRGAEMGKFINFIACEGQSIMPDGYSPIPPNLVQEDFWAIARIPGGVEPPAPTAANCKNPYVDGQTPLLGEPVIQGAPQAVAGGGNTGAGGGAGGSGAHGAAAGAAAGGTAGSGTGGSAATSGASGTSGATGGSSPLAVAQACESLSKSNKALAAEACSANGELKAGFAFVDGQVVRILPDGAEQALRDGSILAASHLVLGPRALELLLWILLGLAVVLGPPLYMIDRNRRRKATVKVSGSRAQHSRRRGGGAEL